MGLPAIDNDAAVRDLRPVAVGRRNWLFCGDGGGRTAAILSSMTSTCRGLGIDPFAYLRDVLDRVAWHPAACRGLLPDRWLGLRRRRTPGVRGDEGDR